MTNEIKFGSWTAPESPLVIEYSLVVIEEIRDVVAAGYQKFSRGGLETGGVLYGAREGTAIRILAMREITCEHAAGPSFALSLNDRVKFAQQSETDAQDPRLEALTAVGWFVSHTRTGILLTPADRETYSRYFPEPWQVTLVVRPAGGGINISAGFFVRQADGSVVAEQSYAEFRFPDRMPGSLDRPARDRAAAGEQPPELLSPELPSPALSMPATSLPNRPRTAAPDLASQAAPGPSSSVDLDPPSVVHAPSFGSYGGSSVQSELPLKPTRRWRWLAPGIIAAVGIAATVGVGVWRGTFSFGSVTDPLSLTVIEQKGQLQIRWNRASNTVARATRGSLVIRDGDEPRTIALKPRDLTMGNFTYIRRSSDVEIRLSTEDANGLRAEEATRFLGGVVANADLDESDSTRLERDALEDEVNRLRVENLQQAERIRQLQRTLVILRSRLGITGEP